MKPTNNHHINPIRTQPFVTAFNSAMQELLLPLFSYFPVIIVSDSSKQWDKMSNDMQASSIHIALQSPPHLSKAF